MKFGEKTVLHITGVDKKGRGVAIIGSRRAKVPFTAPDEEVEATLQGRKQGDLIFQLDTVIAPSPHRMAPRCPYVGRCGGCAWQQFDYPYQLELKKNLLVASLAAAGISFAHDIIPAPEQFYYRNRMDYCIGPSGELGLKEPGKWNSYLNLEQCHLLSPDAVRAMQAFREWMKTNAIAPWNAHTSTGYARYLVIREGKNTNKRMMTVVTSAGTLPAVDALVAALSPFATTIYHGVNPTITDLSLASELHLLYGEEFLTERVANKTFSIHPNSFFQTNTVMAEKLLDTVADFLSRTKTETLLDLYCGSGFFGICLADRVNNVVGVEIDAAAIALATKNAAANNVTNISFTAAKSEALTWQSIDADTIILDPSRAGLHPKVIKALLAKKPAHIIYVSCNYDRFADEWKHFAPLYDIVEMQALDLFPHTPHVELVTLMKLK